MAQATGAVVAGTVEFARINGIRIAYESTGSAADRVVLVHGSWGSRHNWDRVVQALAERFTVTAYDRRGHSDSERPLGQGSFQEDVADLAGLIALLGSSPAWVVGNSAGAVITLQAAAACPEVLRGIIVHEPPLWGVLDVLSPEAASFAVIEQGPIAEVLRRIAGGDPAGAAEMFVDAVAFGPGSWAQLPEGMRQTFTDNAPTFLDEATDPGSRSIDEPALARYRGPVLITSGDRSPAMFQPVLSRLRELLPQAEFDVYRGAGHVPHVTHPAEYVSRILAFVAAHGVTP
ncbi:alpha/beta fold hydrolase [Actinokineospora sp.]|uniref:alpha/beta fold hydrolase n=1 Tax=Actinokineospora sp. TaxID=1872133 RepID=UPI003D6A51E2